MAGLQTLFEFAIAKELKHLKALKEGEVPRAGNERFVAWREAEHDDLVFAVAPAL